MRHHHRRLAWTLLGMAMLVTTGCGGARPYRAMAKAAASEESAFAQASDDRLKIRVRETLLGSGAGLHVTPYVYMGHVFLVGHPASASQAEQAVEAVQAVGGVRSVQAYLPVAGTGDAVGAVSNGVDGVALEAQVKAALPGAGDRPLQIDVAAVGSHIVLLGVVESQDAIDHAVESAQGVSGVSGVTSFLLLPEPGYERLRPSLL